MENKKKLERLKKLNESFDVVWKLNDVWEQYLYTVYIGFVV